MSLAIMTAVWADAPVSGSELLMLLAISDNANDEGEAHPSYRYLARKTRLSERQAVRVVKKLVDQGALEVVETGGMVAGKRRANVYRVLASWRGDILSPLDTGDTPRGDTQGQFALTPMSNQPPEEPSSSTNGSAAPTRPGVEEVFAEWVRVANPARVNLSDRRRRSVTILLNEVEDVEYAKKAVRGFVADRQARGKSDVDLSTLVSTGPNTSGLSSRVDYFAEKDPLGASSSMSERPWSQIRIPDGVPEFTRDSLRALLGELEEAERIGDNDAVQQHLRNVPPGYEPVKADNGRWKVVRA